MTAPFVINRDVLFPSTALKILVINHHEFGIGRDNYSNYETHTVNPYAISNYIEKFMGEWLGIVPTPSSIQPFAQGHGLYASPDKMMIDCSNGWGDAKWGLTVRARYGSRSVSFKNIGDDQIPKTELSEPEWKDMVDTLLNIHGNMQSIIEHQEATGSDTEPETWIDPDQIELLISVEWNSFETSRCGLEYATKSVLTHREEST